MAKIQNWLDYDKAIRSWGLKSARGPSTPNVKWVPPDPTSTENNDPLELWRKAMREIYKGFGGMSFS